MTETVTKMTQHEKADREIAECRERREKAAKVSAEWVVKTEKLVKQWEELNETVSSSEKCRLYLHQWPGAVNGVGQFNNIFR